MYTYIYTYIHTERERERTWHPILQVRGYSIFSSIHVTFTIIGDIMDHKVNLIYFKRLK